MIKDQRTDKEKETSNYFVMGRDTFMSGWGEAEDKLSYAVWFCETKEQYDLLLSWVKDRGDMKHVEGGDAEKFDAYLKTRFAYPSIVDHITLYATSKYHPAYTEN